MGFLYVGMTSLACITLSLPGLTPRNPYAARTFAEEELISGNAHALYPPIPFGPIEQDLNAIYKPPLFRKELNLARESNDNFTHWLGTDANGRDVLTQMLYGTRISMTVGFIAVSLYITIGVVVGAIAGYFGGVTDILISRIIEIVLLFPAFFLILTLVALLGPSIFIIMFVIGITGWPTVARLTRGEVLRQRAIDYTQAARALGASHWRVLFRHVLPNSLSPALVAAPFGIANAIITEAGLSLLGWGVQPPAPSWGTLLRLGSSNYEYWWLVLIPSLAIFACVTIFNLVGNGLRDAMDPRLRA
jgi:peptide/nickel transport system permease protein